MNKFLAHADTKDQLTTYLADKILKHEGLNKKTVVGAWRSQASSNDVDVSSLNSDQEETNGGSSSSRISCLFGSRLYWKTFRKGKTFPLESIVHDQSIIR